MKSELKKQVELVNLNIKVIIAFGILMIIGLLMYLAFFK